MHIDIVVATNERRDLKSKVAKDWQSASELMYGLAVHYHQFLDLSIQRYADGKTQFAGFLYFFLSIGLNSSAICKIEVY